MSVDNEFKQWADDQLAEDDEFFQWYEGQKDAAQKALAIAKEDPKIILDSALQKEREETDNATQDLKPSFLDHLGAGFKEQMLSLQEQGLGVAEYFGQIVGESTAKGWRTEIEDARRKLEKETPPPEKGSYFTLDWWARNGIPTLGTGLAVSAPAAIAGGLAGGAAVPLAAAGATRAASLAARAGGAATKAGAAATTAAAALSAPSAVAAGATAGAVLAPAAVAGLQSLGQEYERSMSSNLGKQQAASNAVKAGIISGGVNAVGGYYASRLLGPEKFADIVGNIAGFLSRNPGAALAPAVTDLLKASAKAVPIGAATGGADVLAQNVALSRDWSPGVLDAIVLGAAGGLADPVITAGSAYLGARDVLKKGGPSDTQPPKDEFEKATGGAEFVAEKAAEIAGAEVVKDLPGDSITLKALDILKEKELKEQGPHEGLRKIEEDIEIVDPVAAVKDEEIAAREPEENPTPVEERNASLREEPGTPRYADTPFVERPMDLQNKTPTFEEVEKAKAIEQVLKEETDELEVSIIQRMPNAAEGAGIGGYFQPSRRAIRTKNRSQNTAWHEFGHALDMTYGAALSNAIKTALQGKDIVSVAQDLLSPSITDAYIEQAQSTGRPVEEVLSGEIGAEFMREYVRNPGAMLKAPAKPSDFPSIDILTELTKTPEGAGVIQTLKRVMDKTRGEGGPLSSAQMSGISRVVGAFDPVRQGVKERWSQIQGWLNRTINDYTADAKETLMALTPKAAQEAKRIEAEDAFGRNQNVSTLVSHALENGIPSPNGKKGPSVSQMLGSIADLALKTFKDATPTKAQYQERINGLIKWWSAWMQANYRLTGLHDKAIDGAWGREGAPVTKTAIEEAAEATPSFKPVNGKAPYGTLKARVRAERLITEAFKTIMREPALSGKPFPPAHVAFRRAVTESIKKVGVALKDALADLKVAQAQGNKKDVNKAKAAIVVLKRTKELLYSVVKWIGSPAGNMKEWAGLQGEIDKFGKEILIGNQPFMTLEGNEDELSVARAMKDALPDEEVKDAFRKLAKDHRKLYENGILALTEAGILKKREAQRLLDNRSYVSLMRDNPLNSALDSVDPNATFADTLLTLLGKETKEVGSVAATSGGPKTLKGTGAPIRSPVTGSSRQTVDTFQAIISFVNETVREIEGNTLKRLFFDAAVGKPDKNLPAGPPEAIAAEVTQPLTSGEPVIALWVDGVKRYLRFQDPAVFQGIIDATKLYEPLFTEPMVDKFTAQISQFVRKMITLAPSFVYRELIRNPITLLIENPNYAGKKGGFAQAYVDGLNTWRQLIGIWGDTAENIYKYSRLLRKVLRADVDTEEGRKQAMSSYRQAIELGEKSGDADLAAAGVSTSSYYAGLGREDLSQMYLDLMARTAERSLMTKPEMALKVWERLANESQVSLQRRVYRDALRQGASEAEAANRAREVLNTRRIGSTVQKMGRIMLFLPAIVRSIGNTMKALKTHPGASLGTAAAILTPFFLAWRSLMFVTGQDERWKEAAGAAYDTNIAFPVPSMLDQTGGESWITVPLPPAVGLLWGAFNRTIDFMVGQGFGIGDYMTSIARALPSDIAGSAPSIRLAAIMGMNYDPFLDQNIVPTQEIPLDVSERPRAQEASVIGDLGSFLSLHTIDPRLIDSALGATMGGLGQVVAGTGRDVERLNPVQAAARFPLRFGGILRDTNILSASWVREVDSFIRRKSGLAGTSEAREWNNVKKKIRTARGAEYEALRGELLAMYNEGLLDKLKAKYKERKDSDG